MPVSIRLSRFGRKDLPFYRVVVVDSRKKRDGEFLETIGTYDGLKTKLVTFKPERYDAWVKLGAQPSDTAKKLYRLFKKEGIKVAKPEAQAVPADKPEKAKKVVKKAAPAKEASPPEFAELESPDKRRREPVKPEEKKVDKEEAPAQEETKQEKNEEVAAKEEPKE